MSRPPFVRNSDAEYANIYDPAEHGEERPSGARGGLLLLTASGLLIAFWEEFYSFASMTNAWALIAFKWIVIALFSILALVFVLGVLKGIADSAHEEER